MPGTLSTPSTLSTPGTLSTRGTPSTPGMLSAPRRAGLALLLAATLTTCGYAPLEARAANEVYDFSMHVEAPESLGDEEVRVWIPVPLAGDYQECSRLHPVVRGGELRESYDELGNRILYLAGSPPLAVDYSLRVRRFAATPPLRSRESGSFAPDSQWLGSTERAPLDAIRRAALFATSRKTSALERARVLFDHAVDRLRRSDSREPSRGALAHILAHGVQDSFDRCVWLCSALRSLSIPSYLEHGYRLHEVTGAGAPEAAELREPCAWLRFEVPSMGFLPADPGRAHDEPLARRQHFGGLDAARIRLSRGRDRTLVPAQRGPALPRFVRPYAEQGERDVSEQLRVRVVARPVGGEDDSK